MQSAAIDIDKTSRWGMRPFDPVGVKGREYQERSEARGDDCSADNSFAQKIEHVTISPYGVVTIYKTPSLLKARIFWHISRID
jgi:hypothetical protein